MISEKCHKYTLIFPSMIFGLFLCGLIVQKIDKKKLWSVLLFVRPRNKATNDPVVYVVFFRPLKQTTFFLIQRTWSTKAIKETMSFFFRSCGTRGSSGRPCCRRVPVPGGPILGKILFLRTSINFL